MRNPKKRGNTGSGLTQPVPIGSFQKVPTGRCFVAWLAERSRKRGFVNWLASYVHLTRRQLERLAREGKIAGVVRSENGYNRDWTNDPNGLAAWIHDRRRFRKGNRRRQGKRKKKKPVTELDRLEDAIRRLNTLLNTDAVRAQIRRAPENRLRRLEMLILRTTGLLRTIQLARL